MRCPCLNGFVVLSVVEHVILGQNSRKRGDSFTIVFGRLYNGMHSFTDCVVGTTLGTSIWLVHWTVGASVDRWIVNGGWQGMSHNSRASPLVDPDQ